MVIVSACNRDDVLSSNLSKSPNLLDEAARLIPIRGASSAGVAYNSGLEKADQLIVAFVHQDVYLPQGWVRRVSEQISLIEKDDPNWGVLGVFGVRGRQDFVGPVWSTGLGKEVGTASARPARVVSLDELVLVLRAASGLRFDQNLPGFHLYGTDIVQTAISRGFSAYAVHAPVIHNSVAVRRLGEDYWSAYRYMQHKWHASLPLMTATVPITPGPRARFRYELRHARLRLTGRLPVRKERLPDPAAKARELGYE